MNFRNLIIAALAAISGASAAGCMSSDEQRVKEAQTYIRDRMAQQGGLQLIGFNDTRHCAGANADFVCGFAIAKSGLLEVSLEFIYTRHHDGDVELDVQHTVLDPSAQ